MNASFRKYLPILIILGFFLGMYLLWQWAIDPVKMSIRATLDRMEERRILEESVKKRLGELPVLERQYGLIREHEWMLDIFTNREDIVRFIEVLEKTAEDSGVSIAIESKEVDKKRKPSTAKERKEAAEADDAQSKEKEKKKDESILGNLPFDEYLPFTLKVTGTYPEVALFLHRLEMISFALDVVSIEIRFLENENKEPKKVGGDLVTSQASSTASGESTPQEAPLPEPENLVEGTFGIVVYVK